MFVATLPDCFGNLELADSVLLLAVKPNPDLNGRQFDFLLMQRITGGGGLLEFVKAVPCLLFAFLSPPLTLKPAVRTVLPVSSLRDFLFPPLSTWVH